MGKPLSPRLYAAAEMAATGGVVADIGADHGQLICHLVGSGLAKRGYACDIADGPLAACARTVAACGLLDKIELRLTNGLRGLPLEEIDCVVIAGMGGELIAEILGAQPRAMRGGLRFILQPMTKAERLRERLYRMGYVIERERAVREGKHLYTVIQAAYTGQCQEADELLIWAGRLPEDGSAAACDLLAKAAKRLYQMAKGENSLRYHALALEIENLSKMLQKGNPL